jgi:hypothetical protein
MPEERRPRRPGTPRDDAHRTGRGGVLDAPRMPVPLAGAGLHRPRGGSAWGSHLRWSH